MLRIARESRRWTRADLVREFTRAARHLGYRGLTITERQVQRWESVHPPTPRPAQARALEALFGQSLAELGWPQSGRLSGVEYQGEWTPGSTVDHFNLTEVSGMDHGEFILSGSALAALAFRYFSTNPASVAHNAFDGDRELNSEEIAVLQSSMDELRQLDSRIGSRTLVEVSRRHCRNIFGLLRARSYSNSVGQKLFAVAADVASFTGWLLFDCGRDAEAQRFFCLALRAARHAEDDLIASTVFAYMSIQKYNMCEWDDALMLATAGRRLASQYDCPQVVASLMTRQARAMAGKGDAVGCYSYLEQAFEQYGAGPGEDHPRHVTWVTLGELHGQAAGCAALLGDVQGANDEYDLARGRYSPQAFRSSSLHMLRLALVYGQAGEIEQACVVADQALGLGGEVQSFRFDEVKGDLAFLLQSHPSNRRVRALNERHRLLLRRDLPRSALASTLHCD